MGRGEQTAEAGLPQKDELHMEAGNLSKGEIDTETGLHTGAGNLPAGEWDTEGGNLPKSEADTGVGIAQEGALLTVSHLTKLFRTEGKKPFAAVDDVSFNLRRNEVLGIVGESGSGKSTIAKILLRLLEPTAGEIMLEGTDVLRLRGRDLREYYRRVQMVFQSPVESFDPRQTVGAGIGEALHTAGLRGAEVKKETQRLLALCGLAGELADRKPHRLSGGQCQRAAIARALAMRPEILVCDEATSALDVTVQKEIMELFGSLRKELSLSIIFICHDIALVQSFSERMLVMQKGRLVEEGDCDTVIREPKAAYTKELIESIL